MTWLLRIARLARQRRTVEQVAVVLSVVALCLLFAGIEHLWGWPDWLVPREPTGRRLPMPRP